MLMDISHVIGVCSYLDGSGPVCQQNQPAVWRHANGAHVDGQEVGFFKVVQQNTDALIVARCRHKEPPKVISDNT